MSGKKTVLTLEIGHKASVRKDNANGYTHEWEVFVRGVNGVPIDSLIEKIIFYLHESFGKTRRIVRSPPYTLKEMGYGGFNLAIDICFRTNDENQRARVNYDLYLQQLDSNSINHVVKENITFVSPLSADFRRKLLGAGAIEMHSQEEAYQDDKSGPPRPPGGAKTKPRHHISRTQGSSNGDASTSKKIKPDIKRDKPEPIKSKELKPSQDFSNIFGEILITRKDARGKKETSSKSKTDDKPSKSSSQHDKERSSKSKSSDTKSSSKDKAKVKPDDKTSSNKHKDKKSQKKESRKHHSNSHTDHEPKKSKPEKETKNNSTPQISSEKTSSHKKEKKKSSRSHDNDPTRSFKMAQYVLSPKKPSLPSLPEPVRIKTPHPDFSPPPKETKSKRSKSPPPRGKPKLEPPPRRKSPTPTKKTSKRVVPEPQQQPPPPPPPLTPRRSPSRSRSPSLSLSSSSSSSSHQSLRSRRESNKSRSASRSLSRSSSSSSRSRSSSKKSSRSGSSDSSQSRLSSRRSRSSSNSSSSSATSLRSRSKNDHDGGPLEALISSRGIDKAMSPEICSARKRSRLCATPSGGSHSSRREERSHPVTPAVDHPHTPNDTRERSHNRPPSVQPYPPMTADYLAELVELQSKITTVFAGQCNAAVQSIVDIVGTDGTSVVGHDFRMDLLETSRPIIRKLQAHFLKPAC